MSDEEVEQITCATYTHARRHPMVLGQIAGWTPPFQLTLPQVGVLIVGYWIMFQTWGIWARFLPGGVALFLALTIPATFAWAARRARVEGRSLVRTAGGWLSLLMVPRTGRAGNRTYREGRAVALGRTTVYVASSGEQGR